MSYPPINMVTVQHPVLVLWLIQIVQEWTSLPIASLQIARAPALGPVAAACRPLGELCPDPDPFPWRGQIPFFPASREFCRFSPEIPRLTAKIVKANQGLGEPIP
jgi:hypothetical protein